MSAVLSQINLTSNALADAVSWYVAAKREEDAAKKKRIEAEDRIIALSPAKDEGATTVEAGGYKVTLTGSMSYKCEDLDALRNITVKWDQALVPVKTTRALDPTGCKYLRRERPDLWGELARVVTIAPAKVSVKVGI
jgi:hypothetical protein